MKTVIIDYGSGNLHSTLKAFEKAVATKDSGSPSTINHQPSTSILSNNAFDLQSATHIVLPGVGAFADCMNGLSKLPGMIAALENEVLKNKKPFLGICVGMQLLAEKGFENGEYKGLGWISGAVRMVKPNDKSLKIPHMGWNDLNIKRAHPFVEGVKTGDHAYFTHSYQFECGDGNDVVASVDYGGDITAIIARDNIIGTQFHPEKSQNLGLRLISNFLRMR